MNFSNEIKPAAWGAAGGALLTMLVGFQGFGWYTGGSAEELAQDRARDAVVVAYTPVCAEMAAQEPNQLVLMMEERHWQRDSFVREAGWVSGVDTAYQRAVAKACAESAAEAFEAQHTKSGT